MGNHGNFHGSLWSFSVANGEMTRKKPKTSKKSLNFESWNCLKLFPSSGPHEKSPASDKVGKILGLCPFWPRAECFPSASHSAATIDLREILQTVGVGPEPCWVNSDIFYSMDYWTKEAICYPMVHVGIYFGIPVHAMIKTWVDSVTLYSGWVFDGFLYILLRSPTSWESDLPLFGLPRSQHL